MKHARLYCHGILTVLALIFLCTGHNAVADPSSEKDKQGLAEGKELFTREWLHGDRHSHAGDGLGPVFNARSCVACHHLGGAGGAGPKETNAAVVSVFVVRDRDQPTALGAVLVQAIIDALPQGLAKQPDRAKLAKIHPALGTENSFPLHRFGAEMELEKWRQTIFGIFMSGSLGISNEIKVGDVTVDLVSSERNAPHLFGVGLIDRISDQVLLDMAAEEAKSPQNGRVSRLKDGRIGRFGWKSQVATLREFTLQACSSELGLEVPGFHRAEPPWNKDYKAPGIDMSARQCDLLVQFVASLPRPVRRLPETPQHATEIAAGEKLFTSMGCAACHRPKLGNLEGIYSDLLLHDMGQTLSQAGSYGTTVSDPVAGEKPADLPVVNRDGNSPTKEKPPQLGAGAREWRTPPLWGLRDSAPYMHDGRADTIVDAVKLHDGEGLQSQIAFSKLTTREREQIELFLQSLAAPPAMQ
jgi:CxxC motif-containing protein (DUF1111 family)